MRTVVVVAVLAGFVLICHGICVAQADSSQPADKTSVAQEPGPGDATSMHTLSGDAVYKAGGAVSPPRVLKTSDPRYTASARDAKIQGTVLVWAVLNTHGMLEQVKVRRSLDPGLDKNAIEAVKHWEFAPAIKDGQPVAVEINLEVNFRLR